MRITADKVCHPGKIFRVGEGGHVHTLDAWTLEVKEIAPGTHFLTLGKENALFQFYLMEAGAHVCVDELDAAILEMSSEEIV